MESTRWIKKFRLLTLTLIFSGALNVGLLAALLVVLLIEDHKIPLSGPLPESLERYIEESCNSIFLEKLVGSSYRELIQLLTNHDLVEDGYRKCDLALSVLVSLHEFNLPKALGGMPVQRRYFTLQREEESRTFELFPSLTEEQFLAVIRFARQEQWPFTPRGLFALLKKNSYYEESLIQAFSVTEPFRAMQTLFPKTPLRDLVDLLCEGDWQMLESFSYEQTKLLDLSEERKRAVLTQYLSRGAKKAIEILLQMEPSFALKKLDDQESLFLLTNYQGELSRLRTVCEVLLRSPRSDMVHQKSAELLYQMEGELLPLPFNYTAALERFFSSVPSIPSKPLETLSVKKQEQQEQRGVILSQESKSEIIHVVKEGETLWKIARFYGVKLEDLVAMNRLEGEKIRSGRVLKIPEQAR